LQTRRAADPHGVELQAEGGNIDDTRECAMAAGTRIEVRELFYNTTGAAQISERRWRPSRVRSPMRFSGSRSPITMWLSAEIGLTHNYELPRVASALERVRQLFGSKLTATLCDSSWSGREFARAGSRGEQRILRHRPNDFYIRQ